MRLIRFTFALLLAAIVLPAAGLAAESISVRAILISASKAKGNADRRLERYEAELQRNLPESSFRLIGEGTTSVSGNGHATIQLGGGHSIELDGKGGKALSIEWKHGNSSLVQLGHAAVTGKPFVLVYRPVGDGETPIVLVIAH